MRAASLSLSIYLPVAVSQCFTMIPNHILRIFSRPSLPVSSSTTYTLWVLFTTGRWNASLLFPLLQEKGGKRKRRWGITVPGMVSFYLDGGVWSLGGLVSSLFITLTLSQSLSTFLSVSQSIKNPQQYSIDYKSRDLVLIPCSTECTPCSVCTTPRRKTT